MSDYISRQAAIEAVEKCQQYKVSKEDYAVDFAEVKTELMMLPTADVRENVRGEWLPMKRFGGEKGQKPDVMCSVCHAPALWLGTLGCIRSNYCPNCGADMRGES